MLVLDAGCRVKQLRFTPDGRHLLAGTGYPPTEVLSAGRPPPPWPTVLDIWSLPDGGRTRVELPPRRSWDVATELAVSPAGDRVWLALRGLILHVRLPGGDLVPALRSTATEVCVSPTDRVVFANATRTDRPTELVACEGDRFTWANEVDQPASVAGFLPDDDRFVLLGRTGVSVHSFAAEGKVVSATPARVHALDSPQVSPDGRYLAAMGYSTLCVYNLTAAGPPGRIKGGSNFGDFRSFAFHPSDGTLAVIHGGPTRVKVYDAATLTPVRQYRWNVGPLNAVAFSPDGTLAAAGGEAGKIVVWDV